MFFLVFFFWGDFGVIGEFRVIGKFREISFILYHLAKAAKCRLALSFIIYHLARLGVRNYTQLVVLKNINLGNKKM